MEEIEKESDRGEDAKEGFAKMDKDKKMKNPVWGKMVLRDVKITKETMKKRRSREAQASTNEGQEKNNFPRIEDGNSMLTSALHSAKLFSWIRPSSANSFNYSFLVLIAGQIFFTVLMAMKSPFSITKRAFS